ncbi:MAG: response regulator [Candidatus Omnitrophica bacterium]|nr:response regulator [Candidatus Omnitrophota bacterium]
MSEERRLVKILLVEDRDDDILIIRKAIKEAGIVNELEVVRDGEEALDYLTRRQDDPVGRPGIILLDLNLPKKNGLEVLKELKANESLRVIPVVVLTVSKRDEDVIRSYNLGCNSFVQKPLHFEEFVEAVRTIGLYWGLVNVASPVT